MEEVVRSLLRTTRTLRTYPADNEMSRRALGDFTPRLLAAVPLELELSLEHFLHGGEPVLPEEPDRISLAGALYRDGIRRLEFRPEVAPEEVERFVLALAEPIHPDDLSEDYVTRLWEAELPHIRVAAIDPYLDLELSEDVLEGKERPTEEPEDIGTDPERDLPPPPEEAFRIAEEDSQRIEQEIAAAAEHRPWASFVAALFETLESPTGRKRLAEVVPLLEASFQRLLDEHRFEAACKLIQRLRAHVPPEAKPMLRDTVRRMVHPERLAVVHEAVEKPGDNPKAVEALLLVLSPLVAETVCEFLARATHDGSRRFYAEVLARIGKPALPLLLKSFRTQGIEVKAALARVLGRFHDPAATKALLGALKSPETPLRREVVRALALEHDAPALNALLEVALSDPDATCRIVALRGLGRARTRLDHGRLIERLESRAFTSLSDEEKDLLFLALGGVGCDDVVPFLAGLLQGGWLRARQTRDSWRRAASALAHVGTPLALAALERGSRARNRELAEICRAELLRARSSS